MRSPTRQALAVEQAALVAALVDGGPLPDGFDERRVRAAAAAIEAKRAHVARQRAARREG